MMRNNSGKEPAGLSEYRKQGEVSFGAVHLVCL